MCKKQSVNIIMLLEDNYNSGTDGNTPLLVSQA